MKETAQKGDRIELRREPDNPHDKNAIAVFNKDGEQLGYINRETAEEFAQYMDDGERITADLDQIIGGGFMRPYGCIIDLAIRGIKVIGGQVKDPNSKWDNYPALHFGKIAIGLLLFFWASSGSPIGSILFIVFLGYCLVKRFKPEKMSLYWKCVAGVIFLLFVIGVILSMISN